MVFFGKIMLKRGFSSADEQDKNESVSEDLGIVPASVLKGGRDSVKCENIEAGCVAVDRDTEELTRADHPGLVGQSKH